MHFTVTINQSRALEWGLNAQQSMLFAFVYEVPSWANPKTKDGKVYYALSKAKIAAELPLLTSKPDTAYRLLTQLRDKGLIELSSTHAITLVNLTDKGREWNKKSDGSEIYPSKVGNLSDAGSEIYPTNQYTSNQGTNNHQEPCANALRDAFDLFWKAVPNKKDKARAQRYFEREAKRHGDPLEFAGMLAADMQERLNQGQMGFAAMLPTTYLNNKRWEDEKPISCPHEKIIRLWNETLPDHVEKVSYEDWTPRHPGFEALSKSWEAFKTLPRQSTGKPVFEDEKRGIEFYQECFSRLAKTQYANREGSEQFVTLKWAAEKHNTIKIFRGDIQ